MSTERKLLADHFHCPNGCDHPQPFEMEGKSYCNACLHDSEGKEYVEMVLCTPETCPDD